MSQIRISRTALDEIEQALEQYENVLSQQQAEGNIKPGTHQIYFDYAERFVRWLKGEVNPGSRNQ